MKGLLLASACLLLCAATCAAQKGKVEADFFPVGYEGDTWTGDVTAVDNAARTLTLTHKSGKKEETFVAALPDAPYEWTHDSHGERVLDFPFDKKSTYQVFKWEGPGFAATAMPTLGNEIQRRPNPPDSNRIGDLSDFKGRRVTVYYTARERAEGGAAVRYNDVWRVRIFPKK